MSRIGRKPVPVPAGVTVELRASPSRKGPKGELARTLPPGMACTGRGRDGVAPSDDERHKALHGLTRTLIANMVEGVREGTTRMLEIQGVGYKAEATKTGLTLALGFSHPVVYQGAGGIKLAVENNTVVKIAGTEQGAGGPGRRGDARDPAARALQGQGHPVPGRAGPPQGRQDRSQVMRAIHAPSTRRGAALPPAPPGPEEGRRARRRPRLVVFRSLKHIYAQLVDDDRGVTLLGVDGHERGRRGRGRRQGGPRQGGRQAARREGQGRRASPRWCSTGPVTDIMAACRRSPTAPAKADWSSSMGDEQTAAAPATTTEAPAEQPPGRRRPRRRRRRGAAATAGAAAATATASASQRVRREGDRDQPRRQGGQGRPAVLVQRAGGRGRRQGPGRHRHRQGQRSLRGGPQGGRSRQADHDRGAPRRAPRFRTRSSASTAPAGCCSSRPPPVPASSPAARCARCSSAPASPTS